MSVGDKLSSKDWEEWENSRVPMILSPVLMLVGAAVGGVIFTVSVTNLVGIAGVLFVSMAFWFVGQCVLAYFDEKDSGIETTLPSTKSGAD